MQTDDQSILDYLKAWPSSFVSGKEIARKVGGKERFQADHGWAIPVLAQMVRHGLIETDHLGSYRLKVEKKKHKEAHVSPQILKILKSSGKKFDAIASDDGNNEPPIPVYPHSDKPGAPVDGAKP